MSYSTALPQGGLAALRPGQRMLEYEPPVPPPTLDVYAAKNALHAAVHAMEHAGAGVAAPLSERDRAPAARGPHAPDPRLAAVLDAYVRDAQPGEDRAEARRRIETAMVEGPRAGLRLNDLGLLALPPVIPEVASLDLSGNRLAHLPTLPCGIQILRLRDNRFQTLPAVLPARLEELDVSRNSLSVLPDTLPSRLICIYAQDNALRALPARLPRDLRRLEVDRNRAPLAEEAAQRLAALSLQRASRRWTTASDAANTRAQDRVDRLRCASSLDTHAVRIPLPLP